MTEIRESVTTIDDAEQRKLDLEAKMLTQRDGHHPDGRAPAVRVDNIYKAFGSDKQRWHWLPWVKEKNGSNGQEKDADEPAITVAVDHLNFEIREGEIFGVLGPNGSGKSTLIRLMSTLLLADEGTITIFGHDVETEAMAVQRCINRVSVEASFFKKLSPMENLLYGARLYGLDGKQVRSQVVEILERLSIPKKNIHQPMDEMSRGMQQKVAVARALLSSPMLLLLDEPTTGLDPRSKLEVQAFVRELRDEHGTTILLTTHDMEEADKLCDRIAILDGGAIVALDTPQALKAMVPAQNGHTPTLEDVFLELTGKKLVKDSEIV
jgi:ABC-2 type transport system ATP-binding protein